MCVQVCVLMRKRVCARVTYVLVCVCLGAYMCVVCVCLSGNLALNTWCVLQLELLELRKQQQEMQQYKPEKEQRSDKDSR